MEVIPIFASFTCMAESLLILDNFWQSLKALLHITVLTDIVKNILISILISE